ncbi:hypothetical protein CcI49_11345 [Frankia sp. CcI49]|uniref:IclR family transcriptional regulator n=1 Tax=Frankia sp. CcI49 TaxID=1745382 RepID=UPI000977D389|nr:IclR family transcriptional regulator [Frankia sp. CcI49]ONH60480.1 hypothetical protein CcI49_11345 [Frankia sp. CcI49]
MRSVRTAMQVLEAVAQLQPVGLSELSRKLGLPKTTVQRGLTSMAESGWLESDPVDSTKWIVSVRAFVVGSTVSDRGGLRAQALPRMNALAAQVKETIHLTIFDGETVLLIERIDSVHPVRAFTPLGQRAELHASSNGKSVLAYLPPVEIDNYLKTDLGAITRHTVTDPEILLKELEEIRTRGYAISAEELQEGVVSVAASIRPGGGRPVGALSISGPEPRMPAVLHDDYGEKVLAVAEGIAAALPVRVLD